MSDLLPLPVAVPPRVSVSPFATPTSARMAIETWVRATSLHLSLSPKGSVRRLRVGNRNAFIQIVLGPDGTRMELPEPNEPGQRSAWLRLLDSVDQYQAAGVTSGGHPFGLAIVQHEGIDPKRDVDWTLRALRALDIDWVDLSGDALGWA